VLGKRLDLEPEAFPIANGRSLIHDEVVGVSFLGAVIVICQSMGGEMEIKDISSLIISILSASISIISILIARKAVTNQRVMQAWIANHNFLSKATDMIIKEPGLLRIFDIDPTKVKGDGITPSELIYINTSLDASSVMSRITGDNKVELTEFRKNFCAIPRFGWPGKIILGRGHLVRLPGLTR
jgi:hypothetical protein